MIPINDDPPRDFLERDAGNLADCDVDRLLCQLDHSVNRAGACVRLVVPDTAKLAAATRSLAFDGKKPQALDDPLFFAQVGA